MPDCDTVVFFDGVGGLSAAALCSKAIRNLYLTGASTRLGSGIPTTIASGILTSSFLLRDHG